jgi:hypothetical protein
MSETPMENYNNYVKIMDSFTINEELQKIQALHHSLDEQNPVTYAILLDSNRKWFTPCQIEWIYHRIANLQVKQQRSLQMSLEKVDLELAAAPISEKMCEHGEVKQISE